MHGLLVCLVLLGGPTPMLKTRRFWTRPKNSVPMESPGPRDGVALFVLFLVLALWGLLPRRAKVAHETDATFLDELRRFEKMLDAEIGGFQHTNIITTDNDDDDDDGTGDLSDDDDDDLLL